VAKSFGAQLRAFQEGIGSEQGRHAKRRQWRECPQQLSGLGVALADDELRQLLDERGAWMLAERLRAAGLPVRVECASLDLVAEVLAEIHGDAMRLMDGEPLREQ
jgi:hypothetical protein